MPRFALSLILLALPVLAHAEAPDRYGPDRDGLRGSAPAMSRGALLTWSSKQRAEQRQQQQQPQAQQQPRPALRRAPPAPAAAQPWGAQASATPQPDLPDRRPTAAERMPASIYEEAPPQAQARAVPRQAPIGQAYVPQGAALQPRRYSVGREFGVEPDRIVIPDPSILAYAPEVGAAVIAQQERDKASSDPGPASPADLDMLEQRQQEAERAEARQKTQADNRAKASK